MHLLPPTGHCNNIHCLAKAINQIAAALFTIHKGSIEDRLKEFLAVRFASIIIRNTLLITCMKVWCSSAHFPRYNRIMYDEPGNKKDYVFIIEILENHFLTIKTEL